MDNDVISIRDAEPGDLAFIYSTWLRELRHNDVSPLADDVWFPAYREHLNRVMSDPAVKVLVIHPTDARREILGYVVAQPASEADPGVLHWVYIKPRYRERYGLCRRLLSQAQVEQAPASFSTRLSRQKLLNPLRSRDLRKLYADPAAG